MSPAGPALSPPGGCPVTVIIKALNEQARIAHAVETALAAVSAVGGEVVLADSASTDRTVAIASAYPIRIVQLMDPRERCCGIGPQLGFQHSRGEFVYLMDGDMALDPAFLAQALAFLAQHPEVAGVGGRVVERNLDHLEYRERQAREACEPHRVPGPVDRLDGGAMYRRLAIQEAGYLSDRNLHSYEEFDLAARLRARGWKLWRLPEVSVSHEGHRTPALRLLARRWASGYAWGTGELLRAALGRPWLRLVLRDVRELRLYAGVWAWWLGLAAVAGAMPAGGARAGGVLALALLPPAVMCWRKRSLARGAYAVLSWCVCAAGLGRGLLRRRRPPQRPIASRILREPQGAVPQPDAGPQAAALNTSRGHRHGP
jgi:GT2 family glycosyltransferase